MYFDKKLAEDNGIEDIYRLFDDGKWTLDKFDELSKTAGADLNGDNRMDLEDQYGFLSTTGSLSIFLPSMCGVPSSVPESDLEFVGLVFRITGRAEQSGHPRRGLRRFPQEQDSPR